MRPLAACTTVRRALAYQSPVVANVARHNRMPLNPLAIPFVHSSKPTTASARQLHPSNSRPQAAASGGVDSGEDHGTPAPKGPPPVFCDLDGVLTDFDKAVVKALGTTPGKLRIRALWSGAEAADGFYTNMEWTEDGKELWEGIAHLKPIILTGLPRGTWAEPQKRIWVERELGPDVEVICCMSKEKFRFCAVPGSILIDDRILLKDDWEAAGGVFIHHIYTRRTFEKLAPVLKEVGLSLNPNEEAQQDA